MATITQAKRPLAVHTPLGPDAVLLVGFSGTEGISQLFSFELELIAANTTNVAFDKLLGQGITVELELPGGGKRYFHGICVRVAQGERGVDFTSYRMEIAPQLWRLTRRAQSRIFQHVTVPDILKKVLEGLDVSFELQGRFEPRDFCVQYRETDFNFASRLMEEEGIYYFFKHSNGAHQMVVADAASSYPDVPGSSRIIFEQLLGGFRNEDRIYAWEKVQELRSGKYTLWDHCFELPHKHLEAEKTIQESVQVGTVTHKLKLGNNESLEIFDWPGEYAQRFDGIDAGGGEQPAELGKIFQDNKRTVELRMQEEAAHSILIRGASACRQLTSGHKFTLERHFNANGEYVLVSVRHMASLRGGYQAQGGEGWQYENTFTCIPTALPYRPPRLTPKPVVHGTQTAVVVGPPGEEIFTDKYGRIKVQFHWDREGKNDANSACWLRVATPWAGKQWGMIHIPRVGHEVVVGFEGGDPDLPIVLGSVYNADHIPPYELPKNKTQSGLKTRSSPRGGTANFNELRFEDKKGSEDIYFHAEKDFHRVVENDDDLQVGHDQTITIKNHRTETVEEGNESVTIKKGNRTVTLDMGNDTHQLKQGNRNVLLDMGNDDLKIKMGNQTIKLDLGMSSTEAMQSIELKVGQSSIKVDQMGVTIKGMMVKIEGQMMTEVKGVMTKVDGSAILKMGGGITMIG
ncbi:MAG: type VI secretion system tip protein VgrG [Pirellulales bacterium]|nr:type VI secretion system tip protein VgrG [Pirellulales bacterium]